MPAGNRPWERNATGGGWPGVGTVTHREDGEEPNTDDRRTERPAANTDRSVPGSGDATPRAGDGRPGRSRRVTTLVALALAVALTLAPVAGVVAVGAVGSGTARAASPGTDAGWTTVADVGGTARAGYPSARVAAADRRGLRVTEAVSNKTFSLGVGDSAVGAEVDGLTVAFNGTELRAHAARNVIRPERFNTSASRVVDASYQWEFGDGATAAGPDPTHTYGSVGIYDVNVTAEVVGANGTVVRVNNIGPTAVVVDGNANFTFSPDRPRVNETVQLDATGIPTFNATTVTYDWGGLSGAETLSGPTPTWELLANLSPALHNRSTLLGLYGQSSYPIPVDATLFVDWTMPDGETYTGFYRRELPLYWENVSASDDRVFDLRSIAYGETKPGFVNDSDPHNGSFLGGHHYEPVSFSGSAGDVVEVGIDANESGRFMSARVRGRSGFLDRTERGRFVLPSDGEYTIRAGFLGTGAGNYTLSLTRVSAEQPVVAVDAPDDPVAGEPVAFTASAAADAAVDTYRWEFGDGATDTGKTVTHTFASTGDYAVEVTVTDADGDTGNASTAVRVTSETVDRYDAAGDGMDPADLERAFEDLEGVAGDGDSGTGTGDGDALSLTGARELIETTTETQALVPTAAGADGSDSGSGGDDSGTEDTDGDGLSDELERNGVPVLKSSVVADSELAPAKPDDPPEIVRLDTDPTEADTDGDGIPDGEELGIEHNLYVEESGDFRETDHVYYAVNSDPTVPASADTDGDGLPNKLEKRGIPILKMQGAYQYSEAGADANVTRRDGDPPVIVRLQTDWTEADTDGDGLSDSRELANSFRLSELDEGPIEGLTPGEQAALGTAVLKQSVDPNQTVYLLKSDPTDPNTDDSGIDDAEEYKKGSDPTIPESFSASAIFPVLGRAGCDLGVDTTIRDPNNVNNCAENVGNRRTTVYEINTLAEYNGGKDPTWLKNVPDRSFSGGPVYLVRVQVETASSVSPATRGDLPFQVNGIEFESATVVGIGESKSNIGDPAGKNVNLFVGADSSKSVYLAVKGGIRGSSATAVSSEHVLFGTATMKVLVPDGPFVRGSVGGTETATVTSQAKFAVENEVPETSPDAARAMVREASRKFAKNTVSAVVPVNGGAGVAAASFSTLSRPALTSGTLLINEGVALFTGVGKVPDNGVDDMVGKAIAGQGAVPAYLSANERRTASANIAITIYRAN